MTTTDDLNQRIQVQIDLLETALRQLQDGVVPDLRPLERDVGILCNDLLSVPGQDSRDTAEKMREMIGLLESLAFELKDFRSELGSAEDK